MAIYLPAVGIQHSEGAVINLGAYISSEYEMHVGCRSQTLKPMQMSYMRHLQIYIGSFVDPTLDYLSLL